MWSWFILQFNAWLLFTLLTKLYGWQIYLSEFQRWLVPTGRCQTTSTIAQQSTEHIYLHHLMTIHIPRDTHPRAHTHTFVLHTHTRVMERWSVEVSHSHQDCFSSHLNIQQRAEFIYCSSSVSRWIVCWYFRLVCSTSTWYAHWLWKKGILIHLILRSYC